MPRPAGRGGTGKSGCGNGALRGTGQAKMATGSLAAARRAVIQDGTRAAASCGGGGGASDGGDGGGGGGHLLLLQWWCGRGAVCNLVVTDGKWQRHRCDWVWKAWKKSEQSERKEDFGEGKDERKRSSTGEKRILIYPS